MTRVLVTGSRDWADWRLSLRVFTAAWKWAPGAVLVSGGCPRGADLIAERIWRHFGGEVERHPAEWDRYGKSAGIRRSEAMVLAGADLCVAFGMPCARCRRAADSGWPFHVSHGAGHCARYAEEHGIPVRRFTTIAAA